MPREAAKEWREKYKIGTRLDNMVFIGPSDAVQFYKKHAVSGENVEQALKRAAIQIAKKRSLTALYKRGKKGEAGTIIFHKSDNSPI